MNHCLQNSESCFSLILMITGGWKDSSFALFLKSQIHAAVKPHVKRDRPTISGNLYQIRGTRLLWYLSNYLFIQHEYRIHMYFNWHWNRLAGITRRRAAIWEHSPCTVSTFLANVSCYCRLDECTLACAHIATRCSVSSLLFVSVLQLSAYIRNDSSSDYSRIRCNYHLVPQIPYPIFFFCR